MKQTNDYLINECNGGNTFRMDIKNELYKCKSEYQDIWIYDIKSFGKCLFLDGCIQTAESDHLIYDNAMLEFFSINFKKMLILGGGDGYIAEMALKRNPNIKINIVEIDNKVIDVCKKHLNQKVYNNQNVNIINDNALDYLQCVSLVSYDIIVCDITDCPIRNDIKAADYYVELVNQSYKILNNNGIISTYIGCDIYFVNSILNTLKLKRIVRNVTVPSFGETCSIVHFPK